MKIAFILPSLANRGPIIFTQYLVKKLKNIVTDIDVLYFNGDIEIDLGVRCHKINFWKRYDFSKYDIIHTTMAKPDIYGMLYCPRDKWIVSMHNYFIEDLKMLYPRFKAWRLSFLWKLALDSAKNIILSSTAMFDYYRNLLGARKNYSIIPYGIDEKSYADIDKKDLAKLQEFIEKGFVVLGSVGLLVYRKGFHQIFEFMNENKSFACIIIGEGEQRAYLEKLINEYNLEERTYLPGFRENSCNYYKYIDIYMHVSYSEGFGLAMLEAMSKRKPIVCSDLPIYKDFFTPNDVALFQTDNVISLTDAVVRIINDKERYEQNSYDLFVEKFNSDVMAKRHLEYYKIVHDRKQI
jgi:glycosyltransferase involved in cell wall biosynthesis